MVLIRAIKDETDLVAQIRAVQKRTDVPARHDVRKLVYRGKVLYLVRWNGETLVIESLTIGGSLTY